jgi:hypothetical protein
LSTRPKSEGSLDRIGNAADERQRSGRNVVLKAGRSTTMNDDIIVYDKAKWHYEGDYPKDLPTENAFTHTGMFLAWLADTGLYHQTSQKISMRIFGS